MALKWPPKDPDENLNYSIDWSRFLDTYTINSVQWYAHDSAGVKTTFNAGETVNGLTHTSNNTTDTVSSIVLNNGTLGVDYKVVCAITFNTTFVAERTVSLNIRQN